ncbi:MAG: DNA cytosine methyltransferase [Deltaproteobacteria bacterium]|nr:DNA cytosine methyltransferase [Deltaproteobacteria bacterium]
MKARPKVSIRALRVSEALSRPTVLEICAGGGGQALGLESAGFDHLAAVEIEPAACATLQRNRPRWKVIQGDVRTLNGHAYTGAVDLLAGGVPCPPFSVAGKQLGADDERDLFPEALRLAKEIGPKAILLENVQGFSSSRFEGYRRSLFKRLNNLGYEVQWRILNACDFGVPQLRPRFVLVALKSKYAPFFAWPNPDANRVFVGHALLDLMASRGWSGARAWARRANDVAPTLVGGSKKHGGPDLGPTRARAQWLELGVDGLGVANEAPGADHPTGKPPRLTIAMVSRIQGFPDSWRFEGGKTAAYRQVGNAFPPPVAKAVGKRIYAALECRAEAPSDDVQMRLTV